MKVTTRVSKFWFRDMRNDAQHQAYAEIDRAQRAAYEAIENKRLRSSAWRERVIAFRGRFVPSFLKRQAM